MEKFSRLDVAGIFEISSRNIYVISWIKFEQCKTQRYHNKAELTKEVVESAAFNVYEDVSGLLWKATLKNSTVVSSVH